MFSKRGFLFLFAFIFISVFLVMVSAEENDSATPELISEGDSGITGNAFYDYCYR